MAAVEKLAAERGACAALRCCPEAKPRAPPTSCLGLCRRLPARQPAPAAPHRPPGRPTRNPRAMSPGHRAGGDARKDGRAGGGGRPATAAVAWAVSALCLLLSVGSAAACLLLGAQAAALQGRVAALEEERELLRRAGPPGALAAWAEPHLERLLREVRGAGAAGGRGCARGARAVRLSLRGGVAGACASRGRLRVRVPGGAARGGVLPSLAFQGTAAAGNASWKCRFGNEQRGGRGKPTDLETVTDLGASLHGGARSDRSPPAGAERLAPRCRRTNDQARVGRVVWVTRPR